jgi:MFS transporter, OPA family, glycerol-3-phosphate transporter
MQGNDEILAPLPGAPNLSDPAELARGHDGWPCPPRRAFGLLGVLILGYIGIYLCRKNFSVAIPVIQQAFGATKTQIGDIVSYSAAVYALGKFCFGPIIDRYGGRICMLFSLAGVALFGALGSMAVSVPMLAVFYSANRLAGSAGWGAMVKQTPNWFPRRMWSLAMGLASLSFVFGGVCALVFSGEIAKWSGDNWRMVLGMPSVVLFVILLVCWGILPKDKPSNAARGAGAKDSGFRFSHLLPLARMPQLWIVCAMGFALYILRETFNVWTVDFFKTQGGPAMSNQIAALLSTPFDAAGAVGIVGLGWIFDRLSGMGRRMVLFVSLGVLAVLVYDLPAFYRWGLWPVETAIALIGFLSYGPYSLLAGALAVEIGGKELVGTVAGLVDSTGYLATILAGHYFGKLLDFGGYKLGFHVLAGVTLLAAFLCLALRSKRVAPAAP